MVTDNKKLNNYDVRAIVLMMEAAATSETSVNFYQTTSCYNPEDSHLHTRRRENLKFQEFVIISDTEYKRRSLFLCNRTSCKLPVTQ
jgi:hypothetical protein